MTGDCHAGIRGSPGGEVPPGYPTKDPEPASLEWNIKTWIDSDIHHMPLAATRSPLSPTSFVTSYFTVGYLMMCIKYTREPGWVSWIQLFLPGSHDQ